MFLCREYRRRRELYGLLQRVQNMTEPTLTPVLDEQRSATRRNRVFPVVLTPWEGERAIVADAVYALTKDISDNGIALVLHSPFRTEAVVIGFALPSLDHSATCEKRGLTYIRQ